MRNILLLLLTWTILYGSLFAQDLIFIKPYGSKIEARVIEITADQIKYRNFDQLDGPIRSIKKSEVTKIVYENGSEEEFKEAEKTKVDYQQYLGTSQQPTENQSTEYRGKYFLLGAGYGNSYGGIGVKFAGRFGSQLGFGFHAGLGYFPFITTDSQGELDNTGEGAILFSAGAQLFFYKWLYVDLQFGSFGQEWSYTSTYYYSGSYSYYDYTSNLETLYGPSLLVGGDFIFGKRFGFNAATGFSVNINDNASTEIVFALDIGFIVAF